MFESKQLYKAVLSAPFQDACIRIDIRAMNDQFQITRYYKDKCFHENVSLDQVRQKLDEWIPLYKQTMLFTAEADIHILVSKQGKVTTVRKPPTHKEGDRTHNREKKYCIDPDLLLALKVKKDKWRQVNRFLELVADLVPHLPAEGPIRVVDFGCGKAVLTFALYAYLHSLFGERVWVYGIDRKEEVLEQCRKIAEQIGYKQLKFDIGSIQTTQFQEPVTFVVALHACDTATDQALLKAVEWEAPLIMVAPCCQHELAKQLHHEALHPLLRHGILREKFAALVTDALRAEWLEMQGYRTQVVEFVDPEHTPKNILIRGVRAPSKKAPNAYLNLKKELQITKSTL